MRRRMILAGFVAAVLVAGCGGSSPEGRTGTGPTTPGQAGAQATPDTPSAGETNVLDPSGSPAPAQAGSGLAGVGTNSGGLAGAPTAGTPAANPGVVGLQIIGVPAFALPPGVLALVDPPQQEANPGGSTVGAGTDTGGSTAGAGTNTGDPAGGGEAPEASPGLTGLQILGVPIFALPPDVIGAGGSQPGTGTNGGGNTTGGGTTGGGTTGGGTTGGGTKGGGTTGGGTTGGGTIGGGTTGGGTTGGGTTGGGTTGGGTTGGGTTGGGTTGGGSTQPSPPTTSYCNAAHDLSAALAAVTNASSPGELESAVNWPEARSAPPGQPPLPSCRTTSTSWRTASASSSTGWKRRATTAARYHPGPSRDWRRRKLERPRIGSTSTSPTSARRANCAVPAVLS